MKINVLAFGIAKDIFNNSVITVNLNEDSSVDSLKKILEEKYPRLKQLASYRIAINNEFADDAGNIAEHDEIALIPPVSGG